MITTYLSIKSSKYLGAFAAFGLVSHFYAHGLVSLEEKLADSYRSTRAGIIDDIARNSGYIPEPEPLPPQTIVSVINRECARLHCNPSLVYAIMTVESELAPDAISTAGAKGLMQVMNSNLKRCGLKNQKQLFEEDANITCGTQIITEELEGYKDVEKGLRVYNNGPKCENLDPIKCKKHKEVDAYVKKVLFTWAKTNMENVKDKPIG